MRLAPRLIRSESDHRLAYTILALVVACLAGCDAKPAASDDGASRSREYPYKVVCTIGMVTDIVREIAGDKANVSGIMGASIDPHTYQASRSDIVALTDADIVFYNGLVLEGKMTDTLIKVSRKRPVFAASDGIPEAQLLSPEEFEGHFDPHIWMDVAQWLQCTQHCANCLREFDPANAEYYQANFERYAARLRKLDNYARETIASIPEDRRILITAHDAFNYFGRAYDIDVRGIQGISTESEAGIKDIKNLVDLLVSRKVSAVFVESSVSQKNVTALVEGAAAQGQHVTIGGMLFSDAMGADGAYEGTYIGMIDHNVTTIARALGGNAPPRGMSGRLSIEAKP